MSTKPLNELLLLPPAAQMMETKESLKAAIEARTAPAELKKGAKLLINQSLLIKRN